MTYSEIADGIACKRWPAPEQIVIDIEILRRGVCNMPPKSRLPCCVVGLIMMACSELFGDFVPLLCGGTLIILTLVMGALDQRRRDRVDAWLNEIGASDR